MPPADDSKRIEVRLFLQAVYERYGYDLREYAAGPLGRRLTTVLAKRGVPHLGELQHRILADPAFFQQVLDDLTINVTEMFRDPGFYRSFRQDIIPVLRTYPLLKIWHAGCSTGEEVFGCAILLLEAGLYERSQIYATDLSARVLAQAREGIFPADRLASFTANYQESGGAATFSDYTTSAYQEFAMRDAVRKNIVFFQHNLVSDHVFGEMHVVFCRNVLFYFGNALRRQVLRKFSQSLVPGGFLCLGSSERLDPATRDPEFVEVPHTERIYRSEGIMRA